MCIQTLKNLTYSHLAYSMCVCSCVRAFMRERERERRHKLSTDILKSYVPIQIRSLGFFYLPNPFMALGLTAYYSNKYQETFWGEKLGRARKADVVTYICESTF
jgi:hypothetical protein